MGDYLNCVFTVIFGNDLKVGCGCKLLEEVCRGCVKCVLIACCDEYLSLL